MKKALIVIAVILALASMALFILQLQRNKAADPGVTLPETRPGQTVPGETTAPEEPEAPEYTFPKDEPLPTGTQPTESDETAPAPTAAPGLDENETPHMEV